MDSFFYNLNQSHYSTYLRFKTIWTIRETDWINPFDPVCGLSQVTLHPVVGGLNDSDWRHKDYDPMKNLSRQLESLDWPRCWVGLGLMIIINNITISEGKNTRNKIASPLQMYGCLKSYQNLASYNLPVQKVGLRRFVQGYVYNLLWIVKQSTTVFHSSSI